MNPPDVAQATSELAAYLGGSHTLSPPEAARYRLKLGELYSKAGQFHEAKPYLTKAGEPGATADVRAVAKVMLARNARDEGNVSEAARLFAEAVATNALPAAERALVRLQAAEVAVKLGQAADALAGFRFAAADTGPVGVAAKVRFAELLARTGDRAEAAKYLEEAVAGVSPTAPFQNTYVRPEQLQAAFEELIALGLKAGDDEAAFRAATAYAVVAAPDRAREKKADVLLARAARLIPLAATDPQARAGAERAYRDAVVEFDALAELLPTAAGKAEAMTKAAAALKAIGDRAGAKAKLDLIVTLPGLPPTAVASACFDAAAVAPDSAAAKVYLQKAIDGGGPAGFHARVRLAAVLRDEVAAVHASPTAAPDAKARAEATATFVGQLLEQVADATAVSEAEKPAHEKALFDLGWAMLKQGKAAEAEARFRKLLQLYPTTAELGTARLCLASALLAQVERSGNPADPRFAEALSLLNTVMSDGDKSLQTQAKLRVARAYLGVGKLEDAVKTATALADASKGTCDELVALSIVYLGYAKQDLWAQASVIESRMRTVYAGLPDAAFPGGPPEYSRPFWTKNWFEYLDKSKARPNDGSVRVTGGIMK
jgi:tetratricopeptide (TPR) repeat protein